MSPGSCQPTGTFCSTSFCTFPCTYAVGCVLAQTGDYLHSSYCPRVTTENIPRVQLRSTSHCPTRLAGRAVTVSLLFFSVYSEMVTSQPRRYSREREAFGGTGGSALRVTSGRVCRVCLAIVSPRGQNTERSLQCPSPTG